MNAFTNHRLLLIALASALIIVSLFLIGLKFYATNEPAVGSDFSLTFRGQPWTFSQDAKELNILYIGYAKCPDVCPMTLSVAAHAFQGLSKSEAEKVRLVFLSVDVENDKPDDVADYAAQFHPSFIGLSGSKEQVDQVVNQYHASYIVEKDEKSYLGYSISHTDRLFFLDRNGIVQSMIPNARSAPEILNRIKEHL